MKIVFWSPMHGTGATSNLLAFAFAASQSMGHSILLTQTHYNLNNLEEPLMGGIADDREFYRDTGIDAVVRHFKAGSLSREVIDNCSIGITDRLSLLAGTRQASRQTYDSGVMHKIVGHVIDAAQEYYDWVIVDANSGYANGTADLLQDADIVVVTLRQDTGMIDALFANEEFTRIDRNKVFYLFGSYDPDSRCNLTNIRRAYTAINHSNSGGLPHCTSYMDAINEHRVSGYISDYLVADRDYADYTFFEALRTIADSLERMIQRTAIARLAAAERNTI